MDQSTKYKHVVINYRKGVAMTLVTWFESHANSYMVRHISYDKIKAIIIDWSF